VERLPALIASKGGKLSSQMNAQRLVTDEKKRNLDEFLSEFDQSILGRNILNSVLSEFKGITSIRQKFSLLALQEKMQLAFILS